MLNKQASYEVIDKILSYCNYYTMILIMSTEAGLTRFANSQIHQNIYNQDNEITITMYDGKKKTEITTNLLDEESLKQIIIEAEENLKFMPDGEFEMPKLTEPKEICFEDYDNILDEKYSISERTELVKKGIDSLEEGFTAAGSLSLNKIAFAMGNNRGIKRYAKIGIISLNLVVMHESGSSGCVQIDTNKADELNIIESFNKAYSKSKLGINPQTIEPGSHTVILEPLAVSGLLGYISYIGFSARAIQLGMSFLTGKLGQKVFGENISVVDDYLNPNVVQLPFDFEGNVRQKLNIIEKGVAKEVAYDTATAIKDNVTTTGHGIGDGGYPIHLIMEGGNDSYESLIESTKKGVLITKFYYMNIVDPRKAVLTGLTRDGFFLIEDGKIKCGLKNMRFTESMLSAFNNVTGITKERAKTPDMFGVNYLPALKIEDFHLTGKTE